MAVTVLQLTIEKNPKCHHHHHHHHHQQQHHSYYYYYYYYYYYCNVYSRSKAQ